MATTIITKNGSGAPADGDLSVGELAVDLTNKRLYTKNNGGVIPLGGSGDSGEWEVNGNDIYYDSGNVGIGTTSPDQTLHVHKGSAGSVSSNSFSVLTLENDTVCVLQTLVPNTSSAQLRFGDNNDDGKGILSYDHSTDHMQFNVNGPERMRIDSSGNLLVGTDTGSFVNGGGVIIANTQAARLKLCDSDTAGTGSADGFEITQAGTAAYIYQNENDFMAFGTNATERMRIHTNGNISIGTSSDWFTTTGRQTLRLQGGSGGSFLVLDTTGSGDFYIASEDNGHAYFWNQSTSGNSVFATANTERMRIDSAGNVLVGRTSQVAGGKFCLDYTNGVTAGLAIKDTKTTGTGVVLQVVNGSGTIVGAISHDQSNTTFSPSSDARLKENIRDYDNALDDVMKLKPRKYSWKVNGAEDNGFIAQELLETPEFANRVNPLSVDDATMYGVDYMKFVAVLTGAIQEQQVMIEELKAEVSALKGAN
jgi:hypothetical protein